MSKKRSVKVHADIKREMGEAWKIEVAAKPFVDGKGGNMPALGYPCAICASKETKLRFAQSTEEEESVLKWMELQCKACKGYTLYTRK